MSIMEELFIHLRQKAKKPIEPYEIINLYVMYFRFNPSIYRNAEWFKSLNTITNKRRIK